MLDAKRVIELNVMEAFPKWGLGMSVVQGKPACSACNCYCRVLLFSSLPLKHTSNYCKIYSEECNEELCFTCLKLEDNSLDTSILECSANLQVSWPH